MLLLSGSPVASSFWVEVFGLLSIICSFRACALVIAYPFHPGIGWSALCFPSQAYLTFPTAAPFPAAIIPLLLDARDSFFSPETLLCCSGVLLQIDLLRFSFPPNIVFFLSREFLMGIDYGYFEVLFPAFTTAVWRRYLSPLRRADVGCSASSSAILSLIQR